MDLRPKSYAFAWPQRFFFFYYYAGHAARRLSFCATDVVQAKDRPIEISTRVVAEVARKQLTSHSLRDFDSGFEFSAALHVVWLPTMATESRVPYYLSIGRF